MNRYLTVIIKKEKHLEYYEELGKVGNYINFVKLITKLEIEMLKYLDFL